MTSDLVTLPEGGDLSRLYPSLAGVDISRWARLWWNTLPAGYRRLDRDEGDFTMLRYMQGPAALADVVSDYSQAWIDGTFSDPLRVPGGRPLAWLAMILGVRQGANDEETRIRVRAAAQGGRAPAGSRQAIADAVRPYLGGSQQVRVQPSKTDKWLIQVLVRSDEVPADPGNLVPDRLYQNPSAWGGLDGPAAAAAGPGSGWVDSGGHGAIQRSYRLASFPNASPLQSLTSPGLVGPRVIAVQPGQKYIGRAWVQRLGAEGNGGTTAAQFLLRFRSATGAVVGEVVAGSAAPVAFNSGGWVSVQTTDPVSVPAGAATVDPLVRIVRPAGPRADGDAATWLVGGLEVYRRLSDADVLPGATGGLDYIARRVQQLGVAPAGYRLVIVEATSTWDQWLTDVEASAGWARVEANIPLWSDSDAAGVALE